MGIVYSTFAPTAVRLAYICQKLFDPKYSCIEDVQTTSSDASPGVSPAAAESALTAAQQQVQSTALSSKVELLSQATHESSLLPSSIQSRIITAKSNSLPRYSGNSTEYHNNVYTLHQQNRNRRARQIRFKTRPSSFDGALIIRAKTKNALILTSTPSPLAGHFRDATSSSPSSSSSGCSSDSNSNSESDSETELRVSTNASNEEIVSNSSNSCPPPPAKLAMTAEEEEDFRLTLGRGHFTRSKKDRFLNNLRLQKQSIYHPTASALW